MSLKTSVNKGEGPVGGWKLSLLRELKNLEENVDQIYSIVNLQTNHIIIHDADESQAIPKADSGTREKDADYETIVNDFVIRISAAAENIDALLNSKTEFELPIPVYIILRLASKVGSIRWRDYKNKPNGLVNNYVYSLTPYLIQVNLIMFQSLVRALGTDMIPFVQFLNQSIMRILEWTRTSNLLKHNEQDYYSIRTQQFRMISFLLEQLSLNINLEPHQLSTLIEVELLEEISLGSKVQHQLEAWRCLDKLFLTHARLLDAALEHKVKSYVIHGCVRIYRDFEAASEVISLECRRQLLRLLETIASQPYATSTTEISYHIFELAEKLESDQEMRCLARTALCKGLAHRPIIVSHDDPIMRQENDTNMMTQSETIDEQKTDTFEEQKADTIETAKIDTDETGENSTAATGETDTIETRENDDRETQPQVETNHESSGQATTGGAATIALDKDQEDWLQGMGFKDVLADCRL